MQPYAQHCEHPVAQDSKAIKRGTCFRGFKKCNFISFYKSLVKHLKNIFLKF